MSSIRKLSCWALSLALAATPALAQAAAEPAQTSKPIVILMIGDGMGPTLLDATSMFVTGRFDALALQQSEVKTRVITDSLDGVTDSAAAATAMASGVLTSNGRVGIDGDGEPCRTLFDTAHERGMALGIVTSDTLYDATPAAFTAHMRSRKLAVAIAEQQVKEAIVDVMLGGGSELFLEVRGRGPSARSLVPDIQRKYTLVKDRFGLEAALRAQQPRLFGVFAPKELRWEMDRTAETSTPGLAELVRVALDVLDRDPQGFLLLVESGRIDKAAHDNRLERAIREVMAFDDTVAAVQAWAAARPEVLSIVTADHDTGYPRLVQAEGRGRMPRVVWSTRDHTRMPIELYAQGPGSELFSTAEVDHRWVHAAIDARLRGEAPRAPARRPGED